MNLDRVRRLFLGRRRSWAAPELQELACLQEVRAEMMASYPRVRVFRIARIVRGFGLRRLPFGLLVRNSGLMDGLVEMFRAQFPRLARDTHWHPLFDSDSYRLLNPDVASVGVSPWLHFQVFGRMEGRSPHPFIDIEFLSASMPGVPVGEVLDRYLSLPELWKLDPSNYVDCQQFLLSGLWDGRTHPLVQLVTRHLAGPWIHRRLMLIDTAGSDSAISLSLAAAVLIARIGSSAGISQVELWDERATSGLLWEGKRRYTVIPGYFLGTSGAVVASTHGQVMSGDGSFIRLGRDFVGVPVGETIRGGGLFYLEGPLPMRKLDEVLEQANDGSVIAPSSAQQQHLLEGRLREKGRTLTVLANGVQSRVVTDSLHIVPAEPWSISPDAWDGKHLPDPKQMAIVVDESVLSETLKAPGVRDAIDAGAAVCAVHGGEVWTWAPLLRARALILADDSLVRELYGLVDESLVRRLNGIPLGSQA